MTCQIAADSGRKAPDRWRHCRLGAAVSRKTSMNSVQENNTGDCTGELHGNTDWNGSDRLTGHAKQLGKSCGSGTAHAIL